MNTQEFIEKAKKVHGDRYDYSKVNYVNSNTNVIVTCPKHGEFPVLPSNHLKGCLCRECANEESRMTTEQFIEKAKTVHGDKFDYSKVNYVNNRTKVLIGCSIHGYFPQQPKTHLSGGGCRECGLVEMGLKGRTGTEEFIRRAKACHDVEYDYSKVDYQGNNIPVIIGCPVHGDFPMTPHQFLKGSNCPKCSPRARLTKEEFIRRSREVHGDKYDYSMVEYIDNSTNVNIICHEKYSNGNEHGAFPQVPTAHFAGSGCPICGKRYKNTELKVLNELKANFKNVVHQKRFDFLKVYHSMMSLDFYLPDYNVAIEYQGLQHFKPVNIFGGEEGHKNAVKRDKEKYKRCKKNGVKLYYLSFEKELPEKYFDKVYTDIQELITEIKKIKIC